MALFAQYLASSLGSQRHSLAAAVAVLSSRFPRILLLNLPRLSTIIADKDKSTSHPEAENTCPVSEFLLNECGFCQSEISVTFKARPSLVASRSDHTAQQAVQLPRDSGFTEQQVRKAIIRSPSIISLNIDRQLKPKIEFMKALGIPAQDLGNVISYGSRLLTTSLEKTLRPNIQYLQNLFGSEFNVSHVFRSAPFILITRKGPETWEKKMKHLTSFGLHEDEIKEFVRRHPVILNASMDKVQKNMDFLMHTAGIRAKFLFSYPRLVNYSLERRIKPRHKVLSALSAMQPSKRPPNLFSALALGIIHWKRKPGLDRTGLGCTFNGTDSPHCWLELLPLNVHQLPSVVWVVTSLHQPSQGPTFGIKGGAAGGDTVKSFPWMTSTYT